LPRTPAAVFRRFRLYSRYHLAAGLFRTWHLRVMAMDAGALILAVIAVAAFRQGSSLAWGALGALAFGIGARVLRWSPGGGQYRLRSLVSTPPARGLAAFCRTAWAGAIDHLLAGGKVPDAAHGSGR
jgi:hypothetical protein